MIEVRLKDGRSLFIEKSRVHFEYIKEPTDNDEEFYSNDVCVVIDNDYRNQKTMTRENFDLLKYQIESTQNCKNMIALQLSRSFSYDVNLNESILNTRNK